MEEVIKKLKGCSNLDMINDLLIDYKDIIKIDSKKIVLFKLGVSCNKGKSMRKLLEEANIDIPKYLDVYQITTLNGLSIPEVIKVVIECLLDRE